jgi:hypothetical protein
MTPDMCGSPVITYLCTKITTMESSFGNPQRAYREFERRNNRGRIVGGLLLVLSYPRKAVPLISRESNSS